MKRFPRRERDGEARGCGGAHHSMASVVAPRDEKEKERRDASCGPARRARMFCPAPRPGSQKAQMFQDKNIGSGPLVGWICRRRDFAPDFANLLLKHLCGPSQDRQTQSANGEKTVDAAGQLVGGERSRDGLPLCFFNIRGPFGSCFGARCFYRRFALKSGRLRRPHHRLGHRGPVRGPARSSGINPLARKRPFVGLPDTLRTRLQPGADPSGTRRPTTNRRRF